MSAFPRSLLSKEEKPCNEVVERILSMICPAAMQRVESALRIGSVLKELLIDVESEAIQLLGTSDMFEKLELLLYQADDMIDSSSGCKGTASRRLNKIARQIREIESELLEKRAYEFRSSFFNKENPRNPKLDQVAGEDFVGRDEDRLAIKRLLFTTRDFVVSIVGDTGLGKTELAKAVFNDEEVRERFENRLWISGFDTLELNSEVVSLLLPPKDADQRLLVVVDGVRNASKSKILREFLQDAGEGSRAVVTTRCEEVAEAFKFQSEDETSFYRLKPLDEEASLILFRAVASSSREDDSEIVKKCGGNPMAIKAMRSLMLLRAAGIKRQSFSQKELLRMPRERVDAIASVKTSYRRLPMHLKPCFAISGLFPMRSEIEVRKLIRLWMSLGFVASLPGRRIEDVALDYFAELLGRFFFEGSEIDESGKSTIPEIFHDLARQVAGIECAALGMEQDEDESKLSGKTRHVSFDFHLDSPWQISDLLFGAKKIRTVVLPSQLRWQIDGRSGTSVCDVVVSNFDRLRALDLQNSGLKTVSESVGKLKHLRYLDLSRNTDVKSLPGSICSLSLLQTLKLNFCGRLEELPREIAKLAPSLRDLELDSCYSLTHMPRRISLLTNLQTLSEFVLHNADPKRTATEQIAELKNLNGLRGELRIKNLSLDTDAREAELSQKASLRSLVLVWEMNSGPGDGTGAEELRPHPNLREISFIGFSALEFPTWLALQESLSKLSLWKCLKCRRLPAGLSSLPRLESLSLEDMPDLDHVTVDISEESTPFFPALRDLQLADLPRLRAWRHGASSKIEFPLLHSLVVEDCPKLETMPALPELRRLVLKNTVFNPLVSSTSASLSNLLSMRIVCSPISNCWPSDLRSVTLDHLPYVKSLPLGLSELAGLKRLNIWRCNSLKDISDCVVKLDSLERLSLKLCLNLELPLVTVSLLASRATELEILDCPNIQNVINKKSS